jgi:hypothetical protein
MEKPRPPLSTALVREKLDACFVVKDAPDKNAVEDLGKI